MRQLPDVHLLREQPTQFHNALLDMAERNGWDPGAIAQVMLVESQFDPRARPPCSGCSAAGLIQWMNSTARSHYGMQSSDEIMRLGTQPGQCSYTRAPDDRLECEDTPETRLAGQLAQLPLVEKYFQRQRPRNPADVGTYYEQVFWPSCAGKSDGHVIATVGSRTYEVNKGLDRNGDGSLTCGDMRSKVRGYYATAKTRPPINVPPNPITASGAASAAVAAVAVAAIAGALSFAASRHFGLDARARKVRFFRR